MKHLSKIDGREYYVSHSMEFEQGQWCSDDINLIWTETQDEDKFMRFVNFYYGEYDYETTEHYIKGYIEMQNSNHISRIDKHRYWIESGSAGKTYVFGCIPGDSRCLIGWYEGEEDYDTTERTIDMYWISRKKKEDFVTMDERAHEISEELNDYMVKENIGGDITPMQSQKWDELCTEMSQLITEIEEQNKPQPVNVDLPMTYVLLIHDALQTIKEHNLNELMTDDDKDHLDEVLERFCEPLMSTNDFDNVTIDFYE